MPYKRKVAPEYGRAWSFGRNTTLHRAIFEEHLGRPLPRSIHVHHINGDKTDNRLDNLEAIAARDHGLIHAPPIHSVTKNCEVCGVEFRPHKTKRKRAKTCGSKDCFRTLAGMAKRKLDANARLEVFRLRSEGWTQTAIAKHFGITQAAIWFILNPK